jgi:hypothetical protein
LDKKKIDENFPKRIDESKEPRRVDETFKNFEKKGND